MQVSEKRGEKRSEKRREKRRGEMNLVVKMCKLGRV